MDSYRFNSRRQFIKKSALTVAGISILGMTPSIISTKESSSLCVIAYNVLQCSGWPKDRELAVKAREADQMPQRFALELSQYNTDIITFAESPAESVVREISGLLNMNYTFFPSAGNWPGAVITRHQIVQSDNVPIVKGERPEDLFTRHWGRATIRINEKPDIVIHSIHLYPHDNPTSQKIREREITLILDSMDKDIREGKNMLISGDLNHSPNTREYSLWMNEGWQDTFAKKGAENGYTIRADQPSRRIDYIMANGPLRNAVLESRPLFEGAFRTNQEDPKSFALSDHLPQMALFNLSKI